MVRAAGTVGEEEEEDDDAARGSALVRKAGEER